MNQFRLDRCIETLDDRVVPTVGSATHAADHSVVPEQLLESLAGVLTSTIGMVKNSTTWLTASKCHSERVEHESFLEALAQGPAHDSTRAKIKNDGEIQPSFQRIDVRVSSPGESHPQALAEPDVNLSAHPAPITEPPP
jgi:hypothetical protein